MPKPVTLVVPTAPPYRTLAPCRKGPKWRSGVCQKPHSIARQLPLASRFGDAGRPARSRAQAYVASPGISTRRHRETRQMPPSKARKFPQHLDSMTLGGPPEATFKGTTVLPASRFDDTERPARSHVRTHSDSPASRFDDTERPARSHARRHSNSRHLDSTTRRGPPEPALRRTTASSAFRLGDTGRSARTDTRRHRSFAGISIRHHRETCQNPHSKAPEFRRHFDSQSRRHPPESTLEGTGVSPASRFAITATPARINPQRHRNFARHLDPTPSGNPPESRLEGTGVSPASRLDIIGRPARIHTRRHRSFRRHLASTSP